jgi:uncharacterized MAPEG superfamily protein
MIYIVLSTMLLYFIHLALPKVLTFKNHRDFSPIQVRLDKDPNIPSYVGRIHSATKNLQESLPVFFACAVLSIVTNVDSTSFGLAWIILRVIYLFLYAYKLNPYRTIAWLGSVVCLILMALNLIQ